MKVIKPKSHHTENELVTLIRQSDREAFNEIYERYWLKLYKVAFEKIKSSDEAEDLVQDLFVSIWMKRETLVIQISLNAYLFAAIKYRIINHISANIVKRDYLHSLNKAIMDYDNATSDSLTFKDTEQWINFGINKLSPKVREVFNLSRQENLSIKEIATKLDVSDQTVKNQISKALKVLRVHLNNISASNLFLISPFYWIW